MRGRLFPFVTKLVLALFIMSLPAQADNFISRLFKHGDAIDGTGDIVTQERTVRDFTRIESSGSYDIVVKVGQAPSLKITFDDNLIDYIITEVHGKTLEIYSDESFNSHEDILVEITVEELEEINLSGSGEISVDNIRSDKFEAGISGSGEINLTGRAEEVYLKVAGSGVIEAEDLVADEVDISISGSGDARVNAVESLEASVNGSGNIYYYGQPDHLSTHVSGSGSIERKR